MLRIYRLHGYYELDHILSMIGQFIPDNMLMNCYALLSETMADFGNLIDDSSIVMRKLNKSNANREDANR